MVKLINNYLSLVFVYILSMMINTKEVILAMTVFYIINTLLTICIKIKHITYRNKRYDISVSHVLYDFIFSIIVVVLSKIIDSYILPFEEDHFLKLTSSIIIFSEFIAILKKFSIFTKNKMYSQISGLLDIRKKKLVSTK